MADKDVLCLTDSNAVGSEISSVNWVDAALEIDGYLTPFKHSLIERNQLFDEWVRKIDQTSHSILQLADSYKLYGLHADPKLKCITYKEWAPNALDASLVGDFNNWNVSSHPMTRDLFGNFTITLQPVKDSNNKLCFAIPHDSKIKIVLTLPKTHEKVYRLPAWITRATPNPDAPVYDARFWNPESPYEFKNSRPFCTDDSDLRIYECHVGISTPEPKIGSYKEFTANVLPRIKDLNYNCIQLMAVMEHAYYASFGYQVTNFFAVSSRYGSPEDLKELIDTAHGMGIIVLLDVVHSHASKNVDDGLNLYDGSNFQYFHDGAKGNHDLWDSKNFNYGKYEVLRFLLSNLKFFLDVYQFDGFRFDGVTSILYKHHGIGVGFTGNYNEYFGGDVDPDGMNYLMLANYMLNQYSELPENKSHKFVSIAEDVSGYPTLCLSLPKGGVGFDYRLAMALPDMWIKLLKEKQDEEWNMGDICYTLTNRRYTEKCICYCESHDQALVGDKTLAFWLMDKEMYTNMSVLTELTPIVDRGVSLHKMIRLLTSSLGGEGYLNFEGNEFGHPEWLDFPREGNSESYHYARRQFNLIDDHLLRYRWLYYFDKEIQTMESKIHWLRPLSNTFISLKHESDKMIVFEKNDCLFIFNFHPSKSYSDYKVGVNLPGVYKVIMNSDLPKFGGHDRIDMKGRYFTKDEAWNDRNNSLMVYTPSRTVMVLALEDDPRF